MRLAIAQGLSKTYRAGDVELHAIEDADVVIEPASFVAFVGPLRSPNSTLLDMIGCVDYRAPAAVHRGRAAAPRGISWTCA